MRVSSINKEIHPWLFCDEKIFSDQVTRLLGSNSVISSEFRAGGFNIYPSYLLIKICNLITSHNLSLNAQLIISRILLNVILNSASCIFIYLSARILFKCTKAAMFGALLFTCSPGILSQSRIWYPDSYLIFFSAGILYFLLKILENKTSKSDIILLSTFAALAVSVKYTSLFLLLPITLVLFYSRRRTPLKNFFRLDLIRFFILFGLSTVIINFSILFHPHGFKNAFIWNIQNYGHSLGVHFSGISFYLITGFITYFTVAIFPVVFFGLKAFARIKSTSGLLIMVTPLAYLLYMGMANLVVIRNVNLVLPYILIFFVAGFLEIVRSFSRNMSALILGIILVSQIWQGILIIKNDLKVDSRELANTWIVKNLDHGITLGLNKGCSENYQITKKPNSTIYDSDLSQRLKYYLLDSRWNSPLSKYYTRKGLLLENDFVNLHYYYFNNPKLFPSSGNKSSLRVFIPKEYKLMKVFNGYGPEVVLIVRKD